MVSESTVCFVGRNWVGGATSVECFIRRKLSKTAKIDKVVREGEDNLDGSQVRGHCIMSHQKETCALFGVGGSVARRALLAFGGYFAKNKTG